MISKELLNEVLKADIRKINNSILDGNLYYYKTFVKCKSKINIYELAHKCKEWALNLGYILYSTVHGYECYIDSRNFIDNTPVRFLAETEPEAIFNACQWILDKDSK